MNSNTITIKFDRTRIPADLKVGDRVILVEYHNTLTDHSSYSLSADNGEGIGGNMNPEIRRYHGWRGSFNDVATNAYGLREVLSMEVTRMDSRFEPRFEDDWWGEEIEFPGEYRITLSEDLATDEE